jgi:hypothetical protein
MDVDPLSVTAKEDRDKCRLQQKALNIWPLG